MTKPLTWTTWGYKHPADGRIVLLDHYTDNRPAAQTVARQNHARLLAFRVTQIPVPAARGKRKERRK